MTAGVRVHGEADGPAAPVQLGPYRLIQKLGEGGMGVVHLALDRSGRAVAIKVLRPHVAMDADARARLAREVESLSRVRGEGVAPVLDADTEGDRPYIVTQFVPGRPLDAVVAQDGPLRGPDLLRLGSGLASALRVIHAAGVVHRDLKPANVLLLDGEPVVIDFGIAHVGDDVRLTMTGLVMGTPGYLSPEVVEGAAVTEATDWWGWAATLAFAASGLPPFGRGPMDVVLDRARRGQPDLDGVDERLVPLLRAALSPRPTERPAAGEVVAALERYAGGAAATLEVPAGAGTQAVPEWELGRWPPPTGTPPSGMPRTSPTAGPGRVVDALRWQQRPGLPALVSGSSNVAVVAEPGGLGRRLDPRGLDPSPQHDPRSAREMRSGTLSGLLALAVAAAALWPVVAILLVLAWSLAARFSDRSVTSLVRRRFQHGQRRSDVAVAVAAAPWHLLSALVASVLALLLPAVVALATAITTAVLVGTATGNPAVPQRALPAAVGALVALLTGWWGPGGAALRRGSRSLVRGIVPGASARELFTGCVLLLAAGLAGWAYVRGGQLSWWPWTATSLPLPGWVRPLGGS